MLYTIIALSFIGGYFLYSNRNYMIKKYESGVHYTHQFKRINNLVATNHKGRITILIVSIGMVLKMLWIYIIQYFNNSVCSIGNNKYVVTYVIKGKVYKLVVKVNRGPSKILYIYDENNENISRLVQPYLGPEEDFHKCLFSPSFFNKKRLQFELFDGTCFEFSENDNISLK